MKKILFLHGFASSGHNGTAIMLREQLYADGVTVIAPDIPVMPAEAMPFLRQLVADEAPDLIVTASMGGLYGEQLRGIPRILINPAFTMAKNLTFGGMGHREFFNKRQDGAKEFKVDRTMIDQFRDIEKQLFKGITADEKALVWGLFGAHDKRVNHQKDFAKHYGKAQMVVFDGEHSLNGAVVSAVVLRWCAACWSCRRIDTDAALCSPRFRRSFRAFAPDEAEKVVYFRQKAAKFRRKTLNFLPKVGRFLGSLHCICIRNAFEIDNFATKTGRKRDNGENNCAEKQVECC